MPRRHLYAILALILLFTFFQPVYAQENPTYPYYYVQSGETLTNIANKFGISVADIIKINNIPNPDIISTGIKLFIPGLEGISGELTTQTVQIGENLTSFIRTYHVSQDFIYKVNRITSPTEVYAGSNLIIPIDANKPRSVGTEPIFKDRSILDVAILTGKNPWQILISNNLKSSNLILPGDFISYQSKDENKNTSLISPQLESVAIDNLPLIQGMTIVVKVDAKQSVNLSGSLNGYKLHFFSTQNNSYYALQGIHAMAEPGLHPFSLQGSFTDGQTFSFEQMLLLKPGQFPKDPPLQVSDETIDPAITKPEDDQVKAIISNVSSDKPWSGPFSDPVDEPVCYKSRYGNRRSYNNSEYNYFHTGLDFGVCAPNLNIYAAAPGKVVFAGPLTVRGNATFIDHGQGVYTGYFHQAEFKVKAGDIVKQGQLIGLIGATGRVTGPHLHWEVWVNGVQVNPVDWLEKTYP